MHECLHNAELLPVSLGELAHRAVQVEIEALREFVNAASGHGAGNIRIVLQEPFSSDPALQNQFTRQITDAPAKLWAGVAGVRAEYRRVPRSGSDDIQECPHDCCFTGAVGPDDPKDASAGNGKADAAQGRRAAELLGDVNGQDGAVVRHRWHGSMSVCIVVGSGLAHGFVLSTQVILVAQMVLAAQLGLAADAPAPSRSVARAYWVALRKVSSV